jgi:hypothetical protein
MMRKQVVVLNAAPGQPAGGADAGLSGCTEQVVEKVVLLRLFKGSRGRGFLATTIIIRNL